MWNATRYADVQEGTRDGVRWTLIDRAAPLDFRASLISSESRNQVSTCIQTLLACESCSVAPGCERVTAIGEIDLATGSRLTDALREAQARAQSVVLDLSAATFIDAGGARILLAADARARASSGSFAIVHPTLAVKRLLQLVGADRALAILRPGVRPPEISTPIPSAVMPPAVARTGMALTKWGRPPPELGRLQM